MRTTNGRETYRLVHHMRTKTTKSPMGTPKGIMTRDFNKQRRDDMRPSSREQSSNRYGDERSPRPARPRLNRKSVDRAWESGAPSHHADYRTRSNNGNRGQAPRNDWRNVGQMGNMGKTDRVGNIRHAIVALPMETDLEMGQPVLVVLILIKWQPRLSGQSKQSASSIAPI